MFWLESDAYFNVEGFLIKALFDSKLECVLHITELSTLVKDQQRDRRNRFQSSIMSPIASARGDPLEERGGTTVEELIASAGCLVAKSLGEMTFSYP